MISSWAAWLLTAGVSVVLGLGLYLLAWHRGYLAGLGDRLEAMPGNPRWVPESEAEFLKELLRDEARRPDKYHEGK